ncbi:hypothetical protein [Fortiea contorta]|uniref:hypothetical protein n=1 Tax=Fortiea contorta TaxID=1892405 RepID=UPI00034CCF87|nr:hypothetical protein [Fortiea contorta]
MSQNQLPSPPPSTPITNPEAQSVQTAIQVLRRVHTTIHQIIEHLDRGSPIYAKQQIAQIISWLANALMIL